MGASTPSLQELQRSPTIPALCGEDFEHLTFVIHGAPEVVRFTIDPYEQSSGAGESHPRALTEPYVNLSIHPALIVQPLTVRGASVQTDGGAPS